MISLLSMTVGFLNVYVVTSPTSPYPCLLTVPNGQLQTLELRCSVHARCLAFISAEVGGSPSWELIEGYHRPERGVVLAQRTHTHSLKDTEDFCFPFGLDLRKRRKLTRFCSDVPARNGGAAEKRGRYFCLSRFTFFFSPFPRSRGLHSPPFLRRLCTLVFLRSSCRAHGAPIEFSKKTFGDVVAAVLLLGEKAFVSCYSLHGGCCLSIALDADNGGAARVA